MEKYTRQNRIAEALNLRGMRQVDLVEKTGLNKTSVNGWIKQRWQPKQKALMAMARVLDVSEMWLAGYDVPKERPVEQQRMDELALLVYRLREDEQLKKLFISMSKLNSDQIKMIESIIYEFDKVNTQQSLKDSE